MNPFVKMTPRDHLLLETYQQLLQHYPRDVVVHLKMAKLFLRMRAWESVFEVCQEIFKLDPNQEQAFFLFGEASAQSGLHTRRGIQYLKRFLATNLKLDIGDKRKAHEFLGMMLGKSG